MRRPKKPKRLSEAALLALTGISHRNLTRRRQQRLVKAVEPRRGRGHGGGRGTTPLEYSSAEVPKIEDLKRWRRKFKNSIEWRWRLSRDGHDVGIAPDLAETLKETLNWLREALKREALKIETPADVDAITACLWKPADMPRGNPLRKIFKGLNPKEARDLLTMLFCVVLGIRLPLFDEPNPYPFQVFKRVFGLPKEWQMPPGLFDVFPNMHDQIVTGLSKVTAEELKSAWRVCRFLDRVLSEPEIPKRDVKVITRSGIPSQPIKLASLMWSSPVTRAATVGLIIFWLRGIKSALGKNDAAVLDRSVAPIFKYATSGASTTEC